MSKYLLAFSVALSAAGAASSALAQSGEAKDAAMSLCVNQAQTQSPENSITNQAGGTVTYKACVDAAGLQPQHDAAPVRDKPQDTYTPGGSGLR